MKGNFRTNRVININKSFHHLSSINFHTRQHIIIIKSNDELLFHLRFKPQRRNCICKNKISLPEPCNPHGAVRTYYWFSASAAAKDVCDSLLSLPPVIRPLCNPSSAPSQIFHLDTSLWRVRAYSCIGSVRCSSFFFLFFFYKKVVTSTLIRRSGFSGRD